MPDNNGEAIWGIHLPSSRLHPIPLEIRQEVEPDCTEKIKCSECQKEICRYDVHLHEGIFYCDKCFHKSFFYCAKCNHTFKNNKKVEVESYLFCKNCTNI
ncbi:unnamed protein product [marine sediment metagenome]|uniref:LIM zinc-binding domain-containing protein n=1 Tax=marine sediment metagenome TaxID=412755 RepID=X1KIY9_9ZZZZ